MKILLNILLAVEVILFISIFRMTDLYLVDQKRKLIHPGTVMFIDEEHALAEVDSTSRYYCMIRNGKVYRIGLKLFRHSENRRIPHYKRTNPINIHCSCCFILYNIQPNPLAVFLLSIL